MNELITTSKEEFNLWLVDKKYVDSNGVLTVKMREAEALWLVEDIQKYRKDIDQSFVKIAKNLWIVFKDKYWIELGFSNFKEFLLSPEIDLAPSVGYDYKTVARLISEGKLNEIDVLDIGASRARALLPAIGEEDDKEVIDEWIAKAGILSTLDLVDEVRGKPVDRYSGSGMLDELLNELRAEDREVFWNEKVHLRIRTI